MVLIGLTKEAIRSRGSTSSSGDGGGGSSSRLGKSKTARAYYQPPRSPLNGTRTSTIGSLLGERRYTICSLLSTYTGESASNISRLILLHILALYPRESESPHVKPSLQSRESGATK
ncbi:MAG: hypothetical protein QW555_06765 [Nitrososphaerota archaeon]